MSDPSYDVTSEAQLDEIYGAAHEVSMLKEIDHVSDHYRAFIDAAPFVVVATSGPEGLDCSPRGDPAGFVRVADARTLLIPDRRGNNRVDSLRNIVRDPRIALLFLIPGIGETLRVNGRARISTDPELRAGFEMQGKVPASVIVVAVERVYFQCPKALVRSRLWSPDAQIPRSALPSTGTMVQALTERRVEAQAYDAAYPQRLKETIY
ncbi:MAG: pyridoxamine 5'-phosphate oxidase family protein [Rhodospirillaceae bacterium]|nr:pyridoxamine 5'-phosphate oxidase family protein [Rhodospirillaceae bacterium]